MLVAIDQSSKFAFCFHRFQHNLKETLTQSDLTFIQPYKILVSFQVFARSKCLDSYLELSRQYKNEFDIA